MEQQKLNEFISQAFNRAIKNSKKLDSALENNGQLTIKFDGKNGTVSGFLRAVFDTYPTKGFTNELIENNPDYKHFANDLQKKNIEITDIQVRERSILRSPSPGRELQDFKAPTEVILSIKKSVTP